jgi:hypothetical protein
MHKGIMLHACDDHTMPYNTAAILRPIPLPNTIPLGGEPKGIHFCMHWRMGLHERAMLHTGHHDTPTHDHADELCLFPMLSWISFEADG